MNRQKENEERKEREREGGMNDQRKTEIPGRRIRKEKDSRMVIILCQTNHGYFQELSQL